MNPVSFSVIIPAYNASATIVASVASCLGQTYPAHEIIVVNDGSTDQTSALLQTRFGSQIQMINLAGNTGPAGARNAGLQIAAGTHIVFQDADDLWHPEKLEHIAGILDRYPEIRFLFHPYTLSPVDFPVHADMLIPAKYPFWKLLLSNPIGTPCVVMANSGAVRFNERLHHMEDYELFLKKAHQCGVYRIAAPFTQVGRPILSAGGQSSRRWKMRLGEIRAWWAFARYSPVFMPLLLPLIGFSMAKHLVKSFFPPRSNY